jgi:predicted ribosomally synthesized peptide with SipW-like signal peptide
MGSSRLVFAAALLALLLGATGAVAWWSAQERSGASGSVHVEILGPQGALWNGAVRVENATALSVLDAAARAANLTVAREDYPGMGTYVRAIGPYAGHGASGWIYEISEGASWRSGDRAASAYPLAPGESVRWRWVDG